jgi:hypothetical protein
MKPNRKRILRDPQGRELEEWEEEDAFEPNGLLKDGYSLRVPLYMKDGTPVDDGFSRAIVDSYKRGRSGIDAGAVLVTDGSDDPWALHRPGPRYLADATARNAANAELAKAYAEYDAEQSERWRGNNKLECVPARKTDARPVMDAVEQAYTEYDKEMAEAWRNVR